MGGGGGVDLWAKVNNEKKERITIIFCFGIVSPKLSLLESKRDTCLKSVAGTQNAMHINGPFTYYAYVKL